MASDVRRRAFARIKKNGAFRWLGRNAIYTFDQLAIGTKHPRLDEAIVVAGSPRSGTTLVMEVLGWLPGHATVFEPLTAIWYTGARKAGIVKKVYVPAGRAWPDGEAYLREVFAGRAIGRHYYFTPTLENVRHRLRSRKLVVKFVHANQLLPWLSDRFAVRGVVFTLRHPCAVVASQLKSGFTGYLSEDGNPFPTTAELREETEQLEPHHPGLLEKIEGLDTLEEILTAIWCMDTIVPLTSPQAAKWYLLPYERLLADQERELERLFAWIGEPVPANARRQLRRPTQVTRDERMGRVVDNAAQLPKWKRTLSSEQVDSILRVVSRFELDFYGDDPLPDYDRLDRYVHARHAR